MERKERNKELIKLRIRLTQAGSFLKKEIITARLALDWNKEDDKLISLQIEELLKYL